MLIEVKVPQLSESVSEATLITWNKKEGDTVERDENLIDIETDKVVLETPAPAGGVLVEILKPDGESVTSGEVLARIDTEAKGDGGAAANKTEKPADKATEASDDDSKQDTGRAETRGEESRTQQAGADNEAEEEKFAPQPSVRSDDEWRRPEPPAERSPEASSTASPAARKILEEKGLTAADVLGTGRGGRVTKDDAVAARAPGQQEAPQQSEAQRSASPETFEVQDPTGAERPEERVPMTRLRARIAERLLQSKQENAILTTFNEVNMKPVVDMRKEYGERFEKAHGVRLGFMGFFVKAVVAALKRYPILNASVDGSDIVYHGYIDIGIAVGTPRGLVVPIIRDADQLSVADIEKQIREFGARAKEGKLTMEELTGGTFSITNGGVFGSMLSTPIINPPQSAILGIHATKDRPVVENGEIVIRPINYLALSYDHRIIDGREAVLGLVAIKEALEDPARLILDI